MEPAVKTLPLEVSVSLKKAVVAPTTRTAAATTTAELSKN